MNEVAALLRPCYVRLSSQATGMFSKALLLVSVLLIARLSVGQDLNLRSSRPTVANSVTIQSKGVLQVETGYEAYPRNPSGNLQAVDTAFSYVPLDRLRLDFEWTAFQHQQQANATVNGISTVQIGGEVLLERENYHEWKLDSPSNTKSNSRLPQL